MYIRHLVSIGPDNAPQHKILNLPSLFIKDSLTSPTKNLRRYFVATLILSEVGDVSMVSLSSL